jgi:hypothetical protein
MSKNAAIILTAYLDKLPEANLNHFMACIPQWFTDIYLPGGIPRFKKPEPDKFYDDLDDDGEPRISDEWIQWDNERELWYLFYRLQTFRKWVFFLSDFCDRKEVIGPFEFDSCWPHDFVDHPPINGK